MPLEPNEQSIRNPFDFLTLDDGSVLRIQSHLYRIDRHFSDEYKRTVACLGIKECYFCKHRFKKGTDFYYFRMVDEEEGVIRIPAGLFYFLNNWENENEANKQTTKRGHEWLIKKTGEGQGTRYTAEKLEAVKITEAQLNENNQALVERMIGEEKGLKTRYNEVESIDSMGGAIK